MLCIVTTVHDPIALAATCQCLGLRRPEQGCVHLAGKEASGWILHLPSLYAPLVFDTLTGLVFYHPRDNAFAPYACIMRFIRRYYDVRAKLCRPEQRPVVRKPAGRTFRRLLPVAEVA
jgi:hypothetical protein